MALAQSPNVYILYARKSSESEDRQVASIEAQIDALKELARREGLAIAKIHSEAKSAKKPGRPVFREMLDEIRSGKARGILCWKLDRLARNPIDGGEISWLLQQGVIQHIRTFERHYFPTDNVLMMAVELGMANQYIRDLSVNVKRGLRAKCEAGWRPGVPPPGYKNSKAGEIGRRTIVIDPKRFPLIRKAFDLVLAGVPVPRVLESLNEDWGYRGLSGKTLSHSAIYYILKNPFYYGIFEYPVGSGNWYRGKHEPMITEEEYERVQTLLGRPGRPRPKRHRFPFTGLIRCGECGAMVTAEEKVKRQKNGNTHYYVYYHCTKRKAPCVQRSVEVKDLTRQVVNLLESIEIPEEFSAWAMKWFRAGYAAEIEDQRAILAAREEAHRMCLAKFDALIDLRLGSEISEEEFIRKKSALTREKLRLEELLAQDQAGSEWIEKAERRFAFAIAAKERFLSDDADGQRRILLDLGSNHSLKDRTLSLDLENMLSELRAALPHIKVIHGSVRTSEKVRKQREIRRLYARSPIVLRHLDNVRTSLRNLIR